MQIKFVLKIHVKVVSDEYLSKRNEVFLYKLRQKDNIAQKDDINSFFPARITIFSGANPVHVVRE